MRSFPAVSASASAGSASSPPEVALPRTAGSGWAFAYLAVAYACQVALLFSALAPARVVFRSAAFGASLLFLFVVPGRAKAHHAARSLAIIVVAILTLSMLNPSGSTLLSVIAHWSFHLAILGPLFWVARLEVTRDTLVRFLLLVWLFNTASSVFGVLQASFPGQFQPTISTLIRPDKVMAIKLASGEWVPRPMGLTDIPGGAASSGLYAVLFGLGVVLSRPFRHARPLGVLSMIAGMVCIYLCQIRAMVVMLGICTIVVLGLFALSGRLSRLAGALTIGGAIGLVGFYVAFALGGETVTDRLSTLIEFAPGEVYRRNRGHYLESAIFEVLPEHPLGAGLGRWGMMNMYFGAPEDSIWAEIQWTGWVLDGGIFLLVAYPAAVVALIVSSFRIAATARDAELGTWAAVVAAFAIGAFALTFSFPVFMSTAGVEFWLIGALLLQAAHHVAASAEVLPS